MYQVVNEEGLFHIRRGKEPVRTPAGKPVTTEHEALAAKLAEHYTKYGVDHDHNCSIALYHAPILDFFQDYSFSQLAQHLRLELDISKDWTFWGNEHPGKSQRWMEIFGEPAHRIIEARDWLSMLRLNQLCAVAVLSRVVLSVNVVYLVAHATQQRELCAIVRNITIYKPELGQLALEELFDNFLFYYRL